MSFTLPAALLGLVLVAGPLLAHLVRRRELPTYALPTARLLARAVARSQRRHRFQDLLLLVLRLVGLTLLVLGAAAPFVRVDPARGDGIRESLVIVLDDSMSMRRSLGDETALGRAGARVREVADQLPSGSEVSLILAGAPARVVLTRSAAGEGLASALAALPERSARGTALADALELARAAFAGTDLRRRLWVLSDFPPGAEELRLPPRVDVLTERVAGTDEPAANLAIVDASFVRTLDAGVVRASVELSGARPEERVSLALTLEAPDGTSLATADLEFPGSVAVPARRSVDLRIPTDVSLPLAGNLRLRSDAMNALVDDDVCGVLLGSASGLHVLLVDGELGATRRQDETSFFARALDAASSAGDGPPLHYARVDAERFEPAQLEGSDVVVLANTRALADSVRRATIDRVRSGGGLLVTTGARFDPVAFNGGFREIAPARTAPSEGVAGTSVAFRAPLPARGFEAAPIRRRTQLTPRRPADVWATLGDAPLIVRAPAGRGEVAILGTSIDRAWGELPIHPGYPALVATLVRELAGDGRTRARVRAAGEDAPLPPGAESLRTPRGSVRELAAEARSIPEEPGAYIVRDASDAPIDAFVIAAPSSESRLLPGTIPARPANGGEGDSSTGAPTGRYPLERWIFLLAGLVLLAEAWLRRLPQKREG